MNCNSNTMPLIDTNIQTSCNNGCSPKDINVICKTIIIPTGQEILGVQGDFGSISRTFILPKTTEEGFDLSDKDFIIVLQNINGEQWNESITAENIEILDNNIKIKCVAYSKPFKEVEEYTNLKNNLKDSNIAIMELFRNDNIKIGKIDINILTPPKYDYINDSDMLNANSTVYLITVKYKNYLLIEIFI